MFDEEADETLLVQREWRSHMQRRVKVKLRGGRGALAVPGVAGKRGPERGGRRVPGPALPSRPFAAQRGPRPASISQGGTWKRARSAGARGLRGMLGTD